jgi:hypothetical protein
MSAATAHARAPARPGALVVVAEHAPLGGDVVPAPVACLVVAAAVAIQ